MRGGWAMAFRDILQVMTDLIELHSSLIAIAERKTEILKRNEVDQLMQIVQQENKLVRQIGELDRQRIDATGRFLIEKCYAPNPRITVSDLVKIIFKSEEKKQLLDLQQQLMTTMRTLRDLNQLNQQLIEHSLAFIDYSIDLISGAPEDEIFYHNPNQSYASKRQGLFDTKA
jgi:flagellar biosynthesis/type III secretory pathway chaperone